MDNLESKGLLIKCAECAKYKPPYLFTPSQVSRKSPRCRNCRSGEGGLRDYRTPPAYWLSVKCPKCGAAVDQLCMKKSGGMAYDRHYERALIAREENKVF